MGDFFFGFLAPVDYFSSVYNLYMCFTSFPRCWEDLDRANQFYMYVVIT